jgi:hypothetical protein
MIPVPVRLQPAFADPEAVVALIRGSGPYWPLARYAQSAEERAASGGGSGGGSFVPPWFRQDVALAGAARVDGAERLLHNPAFIEAARQVFVQDRIVRPTTVYVNLMTPCTYPFIAHVDVPAFRGITRDRYPVWLLHQMKVSGLFEPWRIRLATAVSWFFDGPGGAFHYWPDGPEGSGVVIEPPFENVAVVADNERVYHGVGSLVPPGRAELTDLSIDAEIRRSDGNDGWDVVDGGTPRAAYDDADVRVTVSWKAEVFRDDEEQRVVDEHLDDLTIDLVTSAFAEDLAQRAIPVAAPDDPLHDPAWIEVLAATYVERPPRIGP